MLRQPAAGIDRAMKNRTLRSKGPCQVHPSISRRVQSGRLLPPLVSLFLLPQWVWSSPILHVRQLGAKQCRVPGWFCSKESTCLSY